MLPKTPASNYLLLAIALGSGLGFASCSPKPKDTAASFLPIAVSQALPPSSPTPEDRAIPRYEHIFVIIAENKGFKQIIGNPNAPNLNRLAKTYGLATNFYGVVHPSEANYVAILGGSTFGIHDDDAFYCRLGSGDRFCPHAGRADYVDHTIAGESLVDQLEKKGLTWKGYFEDLPAPGSKAVFAPDERRPLYASKHNGFLNFKRVQDDPKLSEKIVDLPRLSADLQGGEVPNYSHIILNQCHDMHGLLECPGLDFLIQTGDMMVGKLVEQITRSAFWSGAGNNAIVITWDEDNNLGGGGREQQGCCGFDPASKANFGGGHIATIVITNHGPRGVIDRTPYNHYSLLRTTEDAFGIHDYLNGAGETDKGVRAMAPLFVRHRSLNRF